MTFLMRSVQQQSRVTTGTQEFKITGFGTPTAWIVTTCHGTTLGTIRDSCSIGLGWGVNPSGAEYVGWGALHGATTSYASSSVGGGSGVARALTPGSTGFECVASVAAITDGVELTYTTAPTTAIQIRVDLILCDDAETGDITSTTSTGVTRTTPGFEPSLLFTNNMNGSAGTLNGLRGGFGFAAQDTGATITQGAWSQRFRVSTGVPVNLGQLARTGHFVTGLTLSGSTFLEQSYTLDSFDALGFTYSRSVGTASLGFSYLALQGTDRSFWAGWRPTPVVTGADTITSPGFAAAGGWFAPTFLDATDAIEETDSNSVAGLCAWGEDEQYTGVGSVMDGAASSCDAHSLASDNGLDVLDDAGALAISATAAAASGGFTLTYDVVDTTARYFLALVYDAEPVFGFVDEGVGIAEDFGVHTGTPLEDGVSIGETLAGIFFDVVQMGESVPEAKQAARSGMEAGQAGRSGMDAGQGNHR